MISSFNNKSGRSTGFTLVELLLAITLMSMLLGLTYTGLRAAARSSQRGEALLAAGGELRATHQFVRRQLNQMLPLPFAVTDSEEDVRIVFEGDASRIQFVAPMPGYLGSGGPQVQLLEFAHGDDGDVLQFSHAMLQEFEQERLFDRDPVILLERVDSAGFEFMGRDEEGELTGWVSYWDQQEILPVAVRINLELMQDSQLAWPDLVAGVRVDETAIRGSVGKAGYGQNIKKLVSGKGEAK